MTTHAPKPAPDCRADGSIDPHVEKPLPPPPQAVVDRIIELFRCFNDRRLDHQRVVNLLDQKTRELDEAGDDLSGACADLRSILDGIARW